MRFGDLSYLYMFCIIPLILVFFFYSYRKREKLLEKFCEKTLLERLIPGIKKSRYILKAIFLTFGFILLVFALMRPLWGFHWEEIKREGIDIIIAIDVSDSMLSEDVKPNRLERAKRKISDLLKMLEGDRIGLVAFSGTSFVFCPLTLDYGACQIFLDSLSPDLIPVKGTAIADAIIKAVQAFGNGKSRSKALILITDGEDHEGGIMDAVSEAKKQGVKIFCIGIGSSSGSPIPLKDSQGGFKKSSGGDIVVSKLDESTLQKIALETGGSYVRSVAGDLDLEKIYREEIKEKTEKKVFKTTREKVWEERFQWFVFAGLCFVVGEFFIREKRKVS